MTASYIELGLSEIGVYELGIETSLFKTTSLNSVGSSNALFSGVAFGNSAFLMNVAGTSVNIFTQALSNSTVAQVAGIGAANFVSSFIRSAEMKAAGLSDSYWTNGYVVYGAMSSAGLAYFEAVSVEAETLDIQGRAVVNWASGYKRTTDISTSGSTTVSLVANVTANTKTSVDSFTVVSFRNQAVNNAGMVSEAYGEALFRAIARNNAVFASIATSSFEPKIQLRFPAGFSMRGTSSNSFKGYSVSYGSIGGTSQATINWDSITVQQAYLVSNGTSEVLIRPGAPVLDVMPYAWDVVIRPYEDRGAVWK